MSIIIERQGDLLCLNIDGDRLIMYPTSGAMWYNTDANLKIESYGNLLVINTGLAKLIAVPTHTNAWICNASFDPGPDPEPGTGDFSWPYKPNPGEWVTSEFGPRSGRFHEGIDMSGGPALYGEPIPAIGDATVQQAGSNGAFGYSVILNHGVLADGFTYRSLYAHMVTTPPVSVGTTVSKGDTIGRVNNTGSSFGSHLHLEIHKVPVGGSMIWDNLNPSYTSPRTAINPRNFFSVYGDGTWIIS